MFDWMGAEAFAERARAELLATGERARPRRRARLAGAVARSAGWHQSAEVWQR